MQIRTGRAFFLQSVLRCSFWKYPVLTLLTARISSYCIIQFFIDSFTTSEKKVTYILHRFYTEMVSNFTRQNYDVNCNRTERQRKRGRALGGRRCILKQPRREARCQIRRFRFIVCILAGRGNFTKTGIGMRGEKENKIT